MPTKSTEHMRLLNQLKKEIGEIHGEPILQRFRRWQSITSPDIPMKQEPYNPRWGECFKTSTEEMANKLRNFNINYYHIGSTSVPGLASKPIIDIIIQVNDLGSHEQVINILSLMNYKNWGCSPVHPDVTWHWHKNINPVSKVIHLCTANNPWVSAALNFRDYLRYFPDKRREYMNLKAKLSRESNNDLVLYSIKKALLLYRLNKEANTWRAHKNIV
ncbi:GrpB family protein [Agarilytica rhodophyticola]|uniref:GrpB family protein n=1 Tax=Agarilytica rhodophyticola TaxID=1737490 RepID=UPI000B348949|nr:GrpB family protein [Agarilytica rhodophyticola]